MFATLLRRWRLSAPLALIGMVSILVGAMALTPASASGDRPLNFSGFAAGVLGHVETTFTVASADFQACDTGNVLKHGSSHLKVTSGEPLIFLVIVAASGNDFQVKFVQASKCGTEVSSSRTGDGVGNVDSTATLLGLGGTDIATFDIAQPPFTAELIDIPSKLAPFGFAELATNVNAFCKTEGHAHVTASFADNSATGGFTANFFFQAFLGIFNQPVVGLGGTGFHATVNELTSSASGSKASATLIGMHIFGNGVDVQLATSHANISCPK